MSNELKSNKKSKAKLEAVKPGRLKPRVALRKTPGTAGKVSFAQPEILQEKITVEEAKYFTRPQDALSKSALSNDLPAKYDRDVIVLQVRDPWWLFAYWEVKDTTYRRLESELGNLFDSAKKVLRVYDVSYIDFNGFNAHRLFDIEVSPNAGSWYIDTSSSGRSWCVDFGLRLADGRFIMILRSNVVATPLDGPSWITDEEWAVPEDLFARLYATATGLGGSPVRLKKPWDQLRQRAFSSGGISSGLLSPVRKKGQRNFWLIVNTELIVYGATEPDAKVTVCGRPIKLKADGTFSMRFALPDGEQVIPVNAKSSDGIDERTITPMVNKETK